MKVPTVEVQRRRLAILALLVFRVRNARWIPTKDRAQIRAAARPHLRQAIHWLRESRKALLAGDIERHEFLRDRAMWHRAGALIEFYQPYAMQTRQRYDALTKFSGKGGAETAKTHAKPELDDLIRGYLECGKSTRRRAKEWAVEFGVTPSTVRRHIQRIKAERAVG